MKTLIFTLMIGSGVCGNAIANGLPGQDPVVAKFQSDFRAADPATESSLRLGTPWGQCKYYSGCLDFFTVGEGLSITFNSFGDLFEDNFGHTYSSDGHELVWTESGTDDSKVTFTGIISGKITKRGNLLMEYSALYFPTAPIYSGGHLCNGNPVGEYAVSKKARLVGYMLCVKP